MDSIIRFVNIGFRIFCTGLLGAGDDLTGSFTAIIGIIINCLAFGEVRRWSCVNEVVKKRSFTRTFVFSSQINPQHINTDNPNSQPYHLVLNYHASCMDRHPAKNQHNNYNFYY